MKIGALSKRIKTPVETIRYYEREGLLPEPGRTDGNYRVYGEAHAERLAFIRHCRGLDMSLDEVRQLLRVKDDPASDCGDVNELLDDHINHVADRIRELQGLEQQLKKLRERCSEAQEAASCGILSALSRPTREPATIERGHVHATHTKTPRPR
ncbi:MAG: Cd(II)/Pb(II)-responsive transcriptional regulator [Gammaproteobacteria bacterium]|jgi:Cd(II)/Pb(II)-responsive transcriptional regulator|nr:Cd(II)/Pb(II)-responsive transcriptional regulator [Gammaproteobacteria bacterium]MBU0786846.1 Cd(II)/Pb(II)-responsive transcriptional regulator [Gammaproteobacteria bacterium]MBU0813948.1 Cd(II)/Pb(II)-responsive transcriptional regulator [Gammaproteobacteria bacterium]MBU1788579.1 Cd(II)/Pb(II)-responsive transcriptional regulator [Gammaproteobacteria bacterium]